MKKCILILFCMFYVFHACPAMPDCSDISEKSKSAIKSQDEKELLKLYNQAKNQAKNQDGCSQAFIRWLARQNAIILIKRTKQGINEGNQDKAVKILEKSLEIYRHWMALAMMGDFYAENKKYAKAALFYQEALDIIADPESTPKAPNPEIIGKIFKNGEKCRLLADSFVSTSKTRDGSPGGLSIASCRGFVPEKVAVPITFEFDSTEFTEKGKKAAYNMLEDLNALGSPDIILTGHTDPRGDDAYNLKLSFKRAARVRDFLKQNGYTGKIDILGAGEREPYEIEDRENYTEKEFYQMCRRVELEKK